MSWLKKKINSIINFFFVIFSNTSGFTGRSCIKDFCYIDITPTENDFEVSPWKQVENKSKEEMNVEEFYTSRFKVDKNWPMER